MDSSSKIITKSAEETKNFGHEFANTIKAGQTLALVGELGSGKTTFMQGLAQGLGIESQIVSPTFVLMREYQLKTEDKKLKNLYHIDLYRLEKNMEYELSNLGVFDLWGKQENIVVIEWADKAKDLIPKDALWITFEGSGDSVREIII